MMRYLLGTLLFLCVASAAFAKTEYRMASGDCDNSSVGWWSIQRFDNGRLIETWGMDCNGKEYHTFGRAVGINGPLTGIPTETGTCDVGTWSAVTTRAEGGIQTDCRGCDCNGDYWMFEPDAPSQAAPQPELSQFGVRVHMRECGGRYEQVRMYTEPFAPAIVTPAEIKIR
ncbi:MAG TPA: hypothetical protein VHI13_06760 [Candidatus Kapabacteria bacterium]|nr:hypothetical protein [Candidatus Kapabacteria bacterium]